MTNLEKLNQFYVGKKYFMLTISRVYDSGKRRKDEHGNKTRIVYKMERKTHWSGTANGM